MTVTIRARTVEDMLKGIGLLKAGDIEEALRAQKETKERLSLLLLQSGAISNENIAELAMTQLGLSLTPISELEIPIDVVAHVPLAFAHHHRVVPIAYEKDTIILATDNVFNFLALGNFKLFLGVKAEAVLSSDNEIDDFLDKHYGTKDGASLETFMKGMEKHDDGFAYREMKEEEDVILKEEAPVVKLVSLLIAEAFKKRASDIHIEPLEAKFRIRYRIDGMLQDVPGPPKRLQSAVISRMKIMAGMDIAEKRLPQDGRIRIEVGGKELDLRVSTIPAIYGESVVLRILDKSSYLLGLSDLGFAASDEKRFERIIRMPHGIFLITGPTGSGKTTTLYAALNYINKPDKKIITIEDPVEYQISGINQVQVKPQINMTFAAGLRSMMRQAPDMIMIGEIRDYETAQIAIQASLTGHMVFSTLHTNDAPSALTRLVDMGVKPYLVASAVQAVMAQRLVRIICPKCKADYEPRQPEIEALRLNDPLPKNARFHKGKGCEECGKTGYSGRMAIFELMIMNDRMRELVFENRPSGELKVIARDMGMKTLREDGVSKVLKGVTTVTEVIRVTQQDVV